MVAQDSIPADELSLLIDECKRFGLSLTLVAPHAGLLGPGIKLNHVGELPLLDFGFSDPPRSTQALKRANSGLPRRGRRSMRRWRRSRRNPRSSPSCGIDTSTSSSVP